MSRSTPTSGFRAHGYGFDPDDLDAAFEDLDARYLAGEAAPYARVWERALEIVGEVNRHEPGRMIKALAYTDHRRVPFAPGDFGRAVEELWAIVSDARYTINAVHALAVHGCVANLLIEGTDTHGNKLQWARAILFDADEPRLEIYEEADVDAALARFEELRPQERRLENAAFRLLERYLSHFPARDWDAMAEMLTDDVFSDDRRRVVNEAARRGRDAEMASVRAIAELGGSQITPTAIATRGEHLVLVRNSFSLRDSPEPFEGEVLDVVEVSAGNQIASHVLFDVDDVDAAIAELDAQYIAGEAAAHARTWSVVTEPGCARWTPGATADDR